jgi:hypothetical protein
MFLDAVVAQQETLCNNLVDSYAFNVPNDTEVNHKFNEFGGVYFDKDRVEEEQLYSHFNFNDVIPHSQKSAECHVISEVNDLALVNNNGHLNCHKNVQTNFIPGQSTGPEVCLYSDGSLINQ